jgi:hypothetical protein
MGIANFTPHFSRVRGLSFVLAPVHALLALFVPSQSGLSPAQRDHGAQLQDPRTVRLRDLNRMRSQGSGHLISKTPLASRHARPRRLKVLREFEPGVSPKCAGRMVISGRMADVCAELDRMS